MSKNKVCRHKSFRIETFQDYKEMHDFILSLNLEDIDQLNIDDNDYNFTYEKDVSWLEEETDDEYEQRMEREYNELKYKEKQELKRKEIEDFENKLRKEGKLEIYIDSLKREKISSKGLMNYDDYKKALKEIEWIGKQ